MCVNEEFQQQKLQLYTFFLRFILYFGILSYFITMGLLIYGVPLNYQILHTPSFFAPVLKHDKTGFHFISSISPS